MAKYTGKNLYLKFVSTVLSAEFRTFETTENIGTVDQSAGDDAERTYLTTRKDGTGTVELLDQSLGTALWAAVVPGTEGTLEWAPEGTASGKPRHIVNAIVSERSNPIDAEDVVMVRASFQYSGAITDTVY